MGALKVWDGSAWATLGQGGGQPPAGKTPHGEFISVSTQTINASTWETKTGWTEEAGSSANGYSFGGGGKITMTEAGLYEFTGSVGFEGTTNAGSRRIARFLKNNVTPELQRIEEYANAAANADCSLMLSTQIYMAAGDTIQIDMYQNTTAGLLTSSFEGPNRLTFLRVAL